MKWIDIKKQKPTGKDYCVVAADKNLSDVGIDLTVSNNEYVLTHPDLFTHWLRLPPHPNAKRKEEIYQDSLTEDLDPPK